MMIKVLIHIYNFLSKKRLLIYSFWTPFLGKLASFRNEFTRINKLNGEKSKFKRLKSWLKKVEF